MISRLILIPISLVLLAGAAVPVTAEPADSAPLSGPEVEDRDLPGIFERFGEPAAGDPAARSGRLPPRLFFGTLKSLASEETPPELRPTPEQEEQIRAIVEEFRDDMRAFQEEHSEEIAALRAEAGMSPRRGRGPGGQPPPPSPPGDRELTPEQRAAGQKLKALMEQGPDFKAAFADVWTLLTPPQQEYLRVRIDEAAEQFREDRREPMIRKELRSKRGDAAGPRGGLSREEMRERLKNLTPEQREELRAARQQGGGRRGKHAELPAQEDKPAPDMDELELPDPE